MTHSMDTISCSQPFGIAVHRGLLRGFPFSGTILVVSDWQQHRVIIANEQGQVASIVGGSPGYQDDLGSEAQFKRPAGLAIDGGRGLVYVADSGNHCIRALDLITHEVHTVAGNGCMSQRRMPHRGAIDSTPLCQPMDLHLCEQQMLIAMSGLHQVWSWDIDSPGLGTWVGNGGSVTRPGDRFEAGFAQPRSIGANAQAVYVLDHSSSCLRRIDRKRLSVVTVSGHHDGIHGFADGKGHAARMRRPQGLVCLSDDQVLITDTDNHCLRLYDHSTGTLTTVSAGAEPGYQDGALANARFEHPWGITWDGETVYITERSGRVRTLNWEHQQVQSLAFVAHQTPE